MVSSIERERKKERRNREEAALPGWTRVEQEREGRTRTSRYGWKWWERDGERLDYKDRDNGRRGRAHVKTGDADNNV